MPTEGGEVKNMKPAAQKALGLLLREGVISVAEYNRYRYGEQKRSGEIIQVDNKEAAREFASDWVAGTIAGMKKHHGW
jgi:hypothetical protein